MLHHKVRKTAIVPELINKISYEEANPKGYSNTY